LSSKKYGARTIRNLRLFSLDFDRKDIIMKIVTKKEKIESFLICPECSHKISRTEKGFFCSNCNTLYPIFNNIPILLVSIDEYKQRESEYHSNVSSQYRNLHKMNTFRNIHYHQYSLKPIMELKPDSIVLELGCGTGYDAAFLISKGLTVVATDISTGQVTQAREELSKNKFKENVFLYVADAENIPFADETFDGTYITAALHHLQHIHKVFCEIIRCTKSGGTVVIAMEPNRYEWLNPLGFLFSILKKAVLLSFGYKTLKTPIEKTENWREPNIERTFSRNELVSLIKNAGLSVIKIKPVWFTLGFVQWITILLSKISKKDWYISKDIERILSLLDELILKLPLINYFACNWTVWCKKKNLY